MTHFKSVLKIKCAFCKENIEFNGRHTVVGFRMENGRDINACGDCIAKVGRMKLNNDNEGIDRLFNEAGIKLD